MKVKEKILELRALGYSYRKIQDEIKCSKGTIAYHCGEGQKEKYKTRRKLNRSKQHPLIRKIENFIYPRRQKTQSPLGAGMNGGKITHTLYMMSHLGRKLSNLLYNYMCYIGGSI